jgi:hypothetical protein
MAVSLPIVTEFDGKGIKKAIAQFHQLETTGEKAQFVLKKAAVGAGVALAGLAVAIGDATKAAMQDAQAQSKLAEQLRNVTGATQNQIASAEKFISTLSRATGVADDNLRPALAALVRGTKDIAEAQNALTLATDISIATNRDLVEVSNALAMAYQGNMRGLRSLSPEMAALIKEGASLNEVMNVLGGTFGGAAAANAETAAGKMAIFTNSLNEAKESLGAAFLPVLESALPVLQSFADWAGKNTETLKVMTIAIGATAAATVVLNAAMAANPAVALAVGFVAVQAAILRVGTAFRGAIGTTELWNWNLNKLVGVLNNLIDLANRFSIVRKLFGIEVPNIDVEFGAAPSVPNYGPSSFLGGNVATATSAFPSLGLVPAAAIGPTSGGSSGGSRGGAPAAEPIPYVPTGIDPFLDNPYVRRREGGNLTVNINGGLATSADIGQAVVDAIKQYTNVSGPADIAVA